MTQMLKDIEVALEPLTAEMRKACETVNSMKDLPARAAGLEKTQEDQLKAIKALEAEIRKFDMKLPGTRELAKSGEWNPGRAMRAFLSGDWDSAPVEREVHEQLAKRLQKKDEALARMPLEMEKMLRATTTLTPSAAGFLISEEIASELVARPHAQAVAKSLGATVVRPNGWPFKINKRTGGLTAYMVGENSASTASGIAVGQVALAPRKCVARSFLTQEQLAYGTPSTDAVIMEELALAIDLKQDDMAFNGLGASNEPLGIFNTASILGNSGSPLVANKLRFGDIALALKAIDNANIIRANTGVAMPSDLMWEIATDLVVQYSGQTEATYAAYQLGLPFITPEIFKTRTGCNLGVSNQIATTKAVVGEFRNLWMAEFGGVVVSRNDVATDGTNNAYTQEGVHIKMTRWFDSGVVLPSAFYAITGV